MGSLKPSWILDKTNINITWIKQASRPTLPNLAGSFRYFLERQVFSGFAGFVARVTIQMDSLWVQEPN